MIISQTPYRVSVFGGGSDFPDFYRKYGGRVLSFSINKYCYISLRRLPPFFQHRDHLVYSKVENVNRYDEIQHPAVREVLKYFDLPVGVSITHDGDIPARSGIGSSSAFTVGLLNCIYALQQKKVGCRKLAEDAIFIEQERIKETVGSQDQIASAYGGFNRIEFYPDKPFRVIPLDLPAERLTEFTSHLMLFYTGISRISSEVAQEQKQNISRNTDHLLHLSQMAAEAETILRSNENICTIGKMLHDAWQTKKKLSSCISNTFLDTIYDRGCHAGALGGKILGAGAGGFMLFFVPPEKHSAVKKELSDLLYIPIEMDMQGSRIIFNDYGDNLTNN